MHVVFLNPQGNFDPKDSYLTEHPDFGGQLVYVKELCLALADMGVKVDIVTRRIDDPEWPGFSSELDYYVGYEDNPRIVRVECGGPLFLNKERLWPHLEEFVANITDFYSDSLADHATAHYADGGYCGVLMNRRAGLEFTFTGHSLGAQKLDKLGMSLENAESLERQYHFSTRIAAERLSMRMASTIITSTNQERYEQYAHSLYEGAVDVHDNAHFAVIPPGVNTRIFSNNELPVDETIHQRIAQRIKSSSLPYIIASSRLDEKKNILGLVKAFAQSRELQEISRLGIFVRGVTDPFSDITKLSAPEQHVLAPILETIREAQIQNYIDFLDIRSQQELASAYRYFAQRESVFALTAFYEPFGLAPIEAAACGLAVVATENGGPSEIFNDGSGILVDPLDEKDIAHGLIRGLVAQRAYSKRALQKVHATYTWSKTAQGYLAVLEKNRTRIGSPKAVTIAPLDCSDRIACYLRNRARRGTSLKGLR